MTASQPDSGLQHERTMLAWRRTALAMAVAGAICGRVALLDPPSVGLVAAALILFVGAGVCYVTSLARTDGSLTSAVTRASRRRRAVVLFILAVAVVIESLLALAAGLVHLSGR